VQIVPSFGPVQPAYSSASAGDPATPEGHYVRGLLGLLHVPVDVTNWAPGTISLSDEQGNTAPAKSATKVPCTNGGPPCACARTVRSCLAVESDFYASGVLGLAARGRYAVEGSIQDTELQNVSLDGTHKVNVSRWRWAVALPPGTLPYAPLAILPGGSILVAASTGPSSAPATTTLLAYRPDGTKLAALATSVSGTARQVSVQASSNNTFVAVVTDSPGWLSDLYTGTWAAGGFTALTQNAVSGSIATVAAISTAWVTPSGLLDPVLGVAYAHTGDQSLRLGLWQPLTKTINPRRQFSAVLVQGPIPLSSAGSALYIGNTGGGVSQFLVGKTDVTQGVTLPGLSNGATTAAIGAGAAWTSESVMGSGALLQSGLGGSVAITAPVIGLASDSYGPLVTVVGGLTVGKWASIYTGTLSFPTAAPKGGAVVGKSGTAYVALPTSVPVKSLNLYRKRLSSSVWEDAWSFPTTAYAAGEATIDCLRGGPGTLGVYYVPLEDGRLVALVVDDAGLAASYWPQLGRTPGRTFGGDGDIVCP